MATGEHAGTDQFPVKTSIAVAVSLALTGHGEDAQAQQQGRPLGNIDGLLAATALEHGLTIVTRNTRHFESLGVTFIDPWKSSIP